MTTKIIITADTETGDLLFTMKTANREVFKLGIAALKQTVSADDRSFDDDTKQWRITSAGCTAFASWLSFMRITHGATVEMIPSGGEKSEPETRRAAPSTADAYATLYLVPGAPPQIVKAAYRELAKLHHPDTSGGETTKMQRLNEAYERLRFAA